MSRERVSMSKKRVQELLRRNRLLHRTVIKKQIFGKVSSLQLFNASTGVCVCVLGRSMRIHVIRLLTLFHDSRSEYTTNRERLKKKKI